MANKNDDPFAGMVDAGGFDLANLDGSYRSVTVAHTGDTKIRRGDSDAGGDASGWVATGRYGNSPRDNVVVEVNADLTTTPTSHAETGLSQGQRQRDTGRIELTVGREAQFGDVDVGVYGAVGMINGPAIEALYEVKDFGHNLLGMGDARRSEASSDGAVTAGLSGRVDYAPLTTELAGLKTEFVTSVAARAGTDRSFATTSAFLRVGEDSPYMFHPNLPGSPLQDNTGSGLYAGARLSHTFHDTATAMQGTRHQQVTLEAGGTLQITEALSLGASVSKHMLPVVDGQDFSNTPNYTANVTFRF